MLRNIEDNMKNIQRRWGTNLKIRRETLEASDRLLQLVAIQSTARQIVEASCENHRRACIIEMVSLGKNHEQGITEEASPERPRQGVTELGQGETPRQGGVTESFAVTVKEPTNCS